MKGTFRRPYGALTALLAVGLLCAALMARTVVDMTTTDSRPPAPRFLDDGGQGTNIGRPNGVDPNAIPSLIEHDVGNVRTALSNSGALGNPEQTTTYHGWEWPIRSGNNFLFGAGLWVGAELNGVHRVSTTNDGDNGTNEFWNEHIGTIPASRLSINNGDWFITSKSFSTFNGKDYLQGAKGADDDRDWSQATDDWDLNGRASDNWDLGGGYIGFNDDGDASTDEDSVVAVKFHVPQNIDVDADSNGVGGKVWDTGRSGDYNRDGNAGYDPEPHVDEDPAGDISHDRIDNDHDGLVDMDDPDYDGDLNVGFLDDDNDGHDDEDGNARGAQEYFCAYHDIIDLNHVRHPDGDGHTPLNIEILQRSYAFPEAYAQDFILVDYLIRNVGQLPLQNVYIAMFADPDVGAAGEGGDLASAHDGNFYDTLKITDTEKVPIMLQGKFGFWHGAPTPGVFGIEVVKTPISLGELDVTFQNYDRLTGGDPATDADKYTVMTSGVIADTSSAAGDKRMMLSFGARGGGFTILPDSTLPITIAMISGRDLASVKAAGRSAYSMYLHDFTGPAAPDVPQFTVDAYGTFARIRWSNNSEASVDPFYGVPNFEGYTIERSTDQINWQTIASYDLIDTLPPPFEWSNFNLGMPRDTLWLDSAHTHFQYFFIDNNLIPGHTYYYSVRAFSKGAAGAGILSSGRTGNIQQAAIARTAQTGAPADLKQIYVFPNPYRGSHPGESGGQVNTARQITEYPRKLFFMGLPANTIPGHCKVKIYSLAGDFLAMLDHYNGTEMEQWNLNTFNQQEIASGIYYYIVEYTKPTGGTDRTIDKFVVIK
ncbi:MAG TPA: hypothetical protein VGL38_12860 [bacterium]|jgi:hypothetical protein